MIKLCDWCQCREATERLQIDIGIASICSTCESLARKSSRRSRDRRKPTTGGPSQLLFSFLCVNEKGSEVRENSRAER